MLDLAYVRSQFPAFSDPALANAALFENAGGSFPVRHTVEAFAKWYPTKVQPYAPFSLSRDLGEAMDSSKARWALALGVEGDEMMFGPSTSMNTYVLAQAFGEILGPGDEVIVTNQDHEANTGVFRRMADRVGAKLLEWRIDPETGRLDPEGLAALLTEATTLVTFPHCSNIVGEENDVQRLTQMAHAVGARVVVDGVSFVPHGIPDVGALGPDVYLFSLYKVYSVHQGAMVVRRELRNSLPNQGHYFNTTLPSKRLTPAGPDHVQEASAGAVLDYVEESFAHHGGVGGLDLAAREMSRMWQEHEIELLEPVLGFLSTHAGLRLLGPLVGETPRHRCPTVAFVPDRDPQSVVASLIADGVFTNAGHFYAVRVLEGVGVAPDRGVVRLSWVHYTTEADIARAVRGLEKALA